MKLRGKFVVRQVMEDIMAIPVGDAALQFNGMILLNEVSRVIWCCLENDTDIDSIVNMITEKYEITHDEARSDVTEFLDKLREMQLLEE